MDKKVGDILRMVLERIEPSNQNLEIINKSLKRFKEKIEKQIKKQKLDAVLFEGGSFAKKTIIKKDSYDIDIFIMFSEKFRGKNISKLTEKLLKGIRGVSVIHGSRDYFQIKGEQKTGNFLTSSAPDPARYELPKLPSQSRSSSGKSQTKESNDFFIELIPVIKATDPKKAENITDLSYSHVKYINKKIKSQKILNEIKIAKAFCYATKTYGAESYINGFSGYSLELLIYYYKSFLKFIKTIANYNISEGKLIIDIEKHYKKKEEVLLDMNSSKLSSPIILVDPTYKQRNALAALSEETFEKFRQASKKFLKAPSIKDFEIKKIDLEKIKKQALKKKCEFILLELKTPKPKGAVAGSKLLKFYNHLENEIKIFFELKNKGFDYNQGNCAECFFSAKKKKEIIKHGPFLKDKTNVKQFKKEHKNTFEKSGKIYAREKINFSLKEFIENWKKKYQRKINEMSVSGVKIVG